MFAKPVTTKKPPKPLQSRQRKEWEAKRAARPRAVAVPLTKPVNVARIETQANPQPKSPRAENRDLLNMARGKACLIRSPRCVGGTETTVACHGGGLARGKGLGYKVGDQITAWGCWACNDYTDAYSGATAEQKESAFMAGHLRQVTEWRRIVGDLSETPRARRAAHWALVQLEATPIGEPS